MEGYSVTEAASVLGVPTERVWELLARGILSGVPDGETGMRVFLQPRPAPAPAPVSAEPAPGNGGAREPERELSPFRELLTEFRNLTERYGQALLALGESRGEVAALRSRVDLLEARMDLRLTSEAQPPAWPSTPMQLPPERQVPSGAAQPPAPVADAEPADEEEEDHRARRRGPRRATESFAEALARAEDPSVPELPGRTEAAAASASQAEVTLPRDAAIAEPMPLPEEPLAGPEPLGAGAARPGAEPQILHDGSEEEDDEVGEERDDALAVEVEEVAPDTEMPPAEPIEFDADRYTTDIEEPDWLEAEAFDLEEHTGAAEMEIAGGHAAARSGDELDVEPASGDRTAGTPLPGGDELDEALRALGVEPLPPVAQDDADPTLAAEVHPAEDEGTDQEPPERDAEEAASAEPASPLTEADSDADVSDSDAGDRGTEEANRSTPAADEPSAVGPQHEPEGPPQAAPDVEPEWPPRAQQAFDLRRPEFPPPRPGNPVMRAPSAQYGTSPTPASRAYRRLRRIFPG